MQAGGHEQGNPLDQRSARDAGDPGGRVVAIVYAPDQRSCYESVVRMHCPFLLEKDPSIHGVDDVQSVELAIGLVCTLFVHHGVREIVVPLTPPDEAGLR